MLSENRLKKKTIGSSRPNQTYVDTQDTSDDSAIGTAIAVGVTAIAGIALHKSGALKEIEKPLLELADTVAREGGSRASTTMRTVKQWSLLKDLDASQLAKSTGQKHPIPKRSIFRSQEDRTFMFSLAEDIKESFASGSFKMSNLSEIMRDTQEDLHLLKTMVEENMENIKNIQTDYTRTKLNSRLREFTEMQRTLTHYSPTQRTSFTSEMLKAFREDMSMSDEQIAQQIRQSGYGFVRAKDVLDLEDIRAIATKKGVGIDLTSRTNQQYASLLEELQTFANSGYKYVDETGAIKGINKEFLENIIIDPNMRISETGKIIDFRMTRNDTIDFLHDLANEFKIPLVQFNPAKVFGLDKVGRYKPLFAAINPRQFDPNITKIGGMSESARIGNWMADTFGESFRDKSAMVINGNLFTTKTNANGVEELFKLGEGFKIHDITRADTAYGLSPLLNASRQMGGLTTTDYFTGLKKYAEEQGIDLSQTRLLDAYSDYLKQEHGITMTNTQKAKFKLGQFLDLGYQEARPIGGEAIEEGLDTATNLDEMTNKFINWISDKKFLNNHGYEYRDVAEIMSNAREYTYKSMFGDGFEKFMQGEFEYSPRMFTTTKEGFKISKAFQEFRNNNIESAQEELKGFAAQFFVGRNKDNTMNQFFTERSGYAWTIFNQLSEGLGSSSRFLGLSVDNKRSSVNLAWNLLTKRALPVYMLLQIPGMINYFSEPFSGKDENGNQDNLSKSLMRKVVKPMDIKAHHAMDLLGVTKFFKFMGDMTPGSDQISEIQGIHALGLGQTEEERIDYIENGYDPVRKGRWWGSGNTPWTGGKIEYWRPNLYRRVQADVNFSDSKYGSRQEYYNNTWYPNPVNPFAPLNHFVFDRNHYDKKHYKDRPYLQTAPVGGNIPIIGPAFSATIGKIISPPQKMHQEYWNNGLQVNPDDERPSTLLTEGKLNIPQQQPRVQAFNNSKLDMNTFNKMQERQAIVNQVYQQNLSNSAYQAKEITSKTIEEKAGIKFETKNILPTRTYDRYDNTLDVYITPSGGMKITDIPDDKNLYNVNQDLKRWSINKIIGAKQRINIDEYSNPSVPVGNDSEKIDNAFMYNLGEQYNWFGEIAGLKGFAVQQFITGHGNEKARMIEDSGYAYSVNNDFWEENLGGFGGNLSEISRRFLIKRNNKTEYINPIRNTMPSWMPGSNYFTDFKHGDPYSKIMNGEERLPGEGYERLHGLNNLMDFNIGSSSIGYDQAYIVRHMLKQDLVDTGFESDTLKIGTDIHNQLEKEWMDAGLAFSTEGEIKDKRNGIIGYYDAMVHDPTSETGVGIVDIKTTSAKKLEEIRKSGKPLDHHQRQVNYYLWATNNKQSKGYIYYVDKENLNNNYTVGFNYNEDLLKDTLNNVYAARKTIRDAVASGEIGRGELYPLIEQYRILADTAPYSQEFKDVSAKLATQDLTKEQKAEISQIRQRLQQQKEPLRVYDYRFKTSNLKTETVTVKKIIDNNTIITKEYGREHAIKFAGINVNASNSEKFDDTRTKNEAANDEIRKYIRPGKKIQISYDVDEHNKYSKDSTRSIRAVVSSGGTNVNKLLLNKGHATEKENDNSPAAIRARYTKGEIAFGSAMETVTHKIVGKIPFVGSKILQVRSPYEQYAEREVYGKDFQSWNHPIRDIAIPNFQNYIGNDKHSGVGGIMMGAFIGSMFGRRSYGKLVGAVSGALVVGLGKGYAAVHSSKDKAWRPQRRQQQEELNEYVDILKYIKNTKLYEEYKTKAKKEDNFDVDAFVGTKEAQGIQNKLRTQELTRYKKQVKLDFKHRGNYNFNYGQPKYETSGMSKKETISAINKEITELQSDRKVVKMPLNAIKAIQYKQAADQTMYAYDAGDSLVNIMSALPKKERQYFKHFMDAPEEEKQKILRIAPSYLRRALQASWGMNIDKKPELTEYFKTHGLPDETWIGWNEDTNIDDVKVKLVHRNKLDPGEFDIWDSNKEQADAVNIPIPMIHSQNTAHQTQVKLKRILGNAGFDNVQTSYLSSTSGGNHTTIDVKHDTRGDISQQIYNLNI